jgi:UDP-3-O-[3-hydroxymyristoyl] glucosamine N-acyltransferase
MKFSVQEIARIINAEVLGDPELIIKGVSSFIDAGPDEISFADDVKYLNNIGETQAGALIIPEEHSHAGSPLEQYSQTRTLLLSAQPRLAFFQLVSLYHPDKKLHPFIHASAHIGKGTRMGKYPIIEANVFIGDNVSIGDKVHLMPGVYIGDEVVIGNNTLIKPNVTIMDKTQIGDSVIIHSGTVIGSDGFGFAQAQNQAHAQNQEQAHHHKLAHIGYVYIGNNTEIGACNTIDRGTLGKTSIGNGVKTDNLVHIAHNVKIGDNTLIVAQVGIAGSTELGKNVIIAGKSGISGHIKIGDGAIVGPYSAVHSHVAEKEIVSGIPHMPHTRWRKVVSIISRLPEIRKSIFSFEKRLTAIENQNIQKRGTTQP